MLFKYSHYNVYFSQTLASRLLYYNCFPLTIVGPVEFQTTSAREIRVGKEENPTVFTVYYGTCPTET